MVYLLQILLFSLADAIFISVPVQSNPRWYMAKVLSISSQVIYGHVGNSTASFVLQRAGHEVLSLPTVLLSNRPGYSAIAGDRIAPAKLDAMLEAALANGWLAEVDAILTGYIPTAEHARLCERWIIRLRALNPDAVYLCDPIIGDEPAGIYIEEAAAAAIRDQLVPLAAILTPNCFELGWLAGRPIRDTAAAVTAARALARPAVIVTSAPADAPDRLANILVEGRETGATASARAAVQAHGTGDFFAAIFLAHRLNGLGNRRALQAAAAAMTLILAASQGRSELALIETQVRWAGAGLAPAALVPLPGLDAVP
jgi:pyridoxine kinase